MSEIIDRLDELEAQNQRLRDRVDDLETKVPEATDANGRRITLPDLERIGLSRRQALQALALLAAGSYSLPAVIRKVRAADTSSGRVAAKTLQTREVEDQNGNAAISLPGDGSVSIDEASITNVDTSSGYSYSDVTSSRSLDTWQTAPSDRDIEFIVRVSASADATRVNLVVDIKSSQTQNSMDRVDLTIDSNDVLSIGAYRVPAGFEYQVRAGGDTGSFSLDKWFELK